MMMSSAAYIIEHPKAAKDEVAVNRAGLESALRAYGNLVSQEPQAKLADIDAVIEKQQKGEFDRYVSDATKACHRSRKS